MKTHEQPTAGPDAETLALQRELADLMKSDGPAFVAVVRPADQLVAAGAARNEAYRLALCAARPAEAGPLRCPSTFTTR